MILRVIRQNGSLVLESCNFADGAILSVRKMASFDITYIYSYVMDKTIIN